MEKLFACLDEGAAQYVLGKSQRTGQPVGLSDTNRCTYIIGRSGMGKSTLMTKLILADIAEGDRSVIVLDPHNELVESVASKCPPDQAHRVTYFAPSAQRNKILGFNPFEISSQDEQEYELKADAIMQVFAHTWKLNYAYTPTMQNTLETFARTLLSAYPQYKTSFLHMLCLTQLDDVGDYWRARLSALVGNNPAMNQTWSEWLKEGRREKDIESSRKKINHFNISDAIWPILYQPTSSECFNFQKMLSSKGVLLVALGGLDLEFVRLLGSLILTQLLVAVKLHKKEDRQPCNVYADEFYYFNPESFKFIIDEGRKHKLFCTIAHQSLKQISDRVAAIVQGSEGIVVFSVSPDDAQRLRKHFFTNKKGFVSPHVVANLPKYQALVRYERNDRRVQDWIKTIEEDRPGDREVASAIWQRSLSFGRSMQDIEKTKNAILNVITQPDQHSREHIIPEDDMDFGVKTKAPTGGKGFVG